jgi:hypothetical protein
MRFPLCMNFTIPRDSDGTGQGVGAQATGPGENGPDGQEGDTGQEGQEGEETDMGPAPTPPDPPDLGPPTNLDPNTPGIDLGPGSFSAPTPAGPNPPNSGIDI